MKAVRMTKTTRALLIIFLLALLTAVPQIGCTTSSSTPGRTSVADCVGIRIPYMSYGEPELQVDLRPKKNAIAGKSYTVTLFENGKYRDYTQVSFTQAEINIGSAVVYFPATQDEEDAYCKIDAEATRNQKVFQDVITIDLRNIFSAVVCETIAVDFATVGKIYMEMVPDGHSYRIVVELTPTDDAEAEYNYDVGLRYTNDEGSRKYVPFDDYARWAEKEISSHAMTKSYAGGMSKEYCEEILKGSPEVEVTPAYDQYG